MLATTDGEDGPTAVVVRSVVGIAIQKMAEETPLKRYLREVQRYLRGASGAVGAPRK